MFQKLKSFIIHWSASIAFLLSFVCLVVTLSNSASLIRTNGRLDSVIKTVNEQNSLIIKQNKDICTTLETINVHLALLDKYASSQWDWYIGNGTDVVINNSKIKSK